MAAAMERDRTRADRGRVRQQENRDTRAWKLYRYITRAGISPADVRLWGDEEWAVAGRAAKLNPKNPTPGPETRGQVVGYLATFQGGAR